MANRIFQEWKSTRADVYVAESGMYRQFADVPSGESYVVVEVVLNMIMVAETGELLKFIFDEPVLQAGTVIPKSEQTSSNVTGALASKATQMVTVF